MGFDLITTCKHCKMEVSWCVCMLDRGGGQGLRALAASLLGVELDKSWRLRCSDWETPQLSLQQVHIHIL